MLELENIRKGVLIDGLIPGRTVTVMATTWYGDDDVEVVYEDDRKRVDRTLVSPGDTEGGWGQGDRPGPGPGGPRTQAPRPTKFYGVVELDPVRAIRDLGAVMEEVAKHLKAGGKDLTLTLEINATSDGFDTRTQRIVKENVTQLSFESHEFEA